VKRGVPSNHHLSDKNSRKKKSKTNLHMKQQATCNSFAHTHTHTHRGLPLTTEKQNQQHQTNKQTTLQKDAAFLSLPSPSIKNGKRQHESWRGVRGREDCVCVRACGLSGSLCILWPPKFAVNNLSNYWNAHLFAFVQMCKTDVCQCPKEYRSSFILLYAAPVWW
jgi:hypothetical protein